MAGTWWLAAAVVAAWFVRTCVVCAFRLGPTIIDLAPRSFRCKLQAESWLVTNIGTLRAQEQLVTMNACREQG